MYTSYAAPCSKNNQNVSSELFQEDYELSQQPTKNISSLEKKAGSHPKVPFAILLETARSTHHLAALPTHGCIQQAVVSNVCIIFNLMSELLEVEERSSRDNLKGHAREKKHTYKWAQKIEGKVLSAITAGACSSCLCQLPVSSSNNIQKAESETLNSFSSFKMHCTNK